MTEGEGVPADYRFHQHDLLDRGTAPPAFHSSAAGQRGSSQTAPADSDLSGHPFRFFSDGHSDLFRTVIPEVPDTVAVARSASGVQLGGCGLIFLAGWRLRKWPARAIFQCV
jgi:hypothetical protein